MKFSEILSNSHTGELYRVPNFVFVGEAGGFADGVETIDRWMWISFKAMHKCFSREVWMHVKQS